MTDTDTRAALDAAIKAHDPTCGYETSGEWELHRAIAAHVEAEVARWLAAAPSVEEAMYALVNAAFDNGVASTRDGPLPNEAGGRDARATLRAAIAADRERAVGTERDRVIAAVREYGYGTFDGGVGLDAALRALGVEA